jgi:hypothetical protein
VLLAPPPPAELPAEALLARLRSRRAKLDRSGESPGAPELAVALAWLHPRLEGHLRVAIQPCLEIAAMHCLLLALRYRLGDEPVPAGLLHQPWLADDLVSLLDQPGEAATLLARLEAWLASDYPFAKGLLEGYLRQGPGQVEHQLAAGMLGQALARARAPVVQMTLRFFADMRNLLAVLRHWRWRVPVVPPLLAGGELDAERLARAWESGDVAMLKRLAARLANGALADLDPREAERALLGGLTHRLQRAGRDPLGIGVIIDYLWCCQIASRNRALQELADGEGDLLAAALL